MNDISKVNKLYILTVVNKLINSKINPVVSTPILPVYRAYKQKYTLYQSLKSRVGKSIKLTTIIIVKLLL